MLHVICPRPCLANNLGSLSCQGKPLRACTRLDCCAQHPEESRTSSSPYRELLGGRLVDGLGDLAKSLGKGKVKVDTERRRKGEDIIRKLLPEGSSVEDVHLTAYQVAETVHALSRLGSSYFFEREMELLLQSAARDIEEFSGKRTARLLYSAAYASHYSPAVAALAASPCLQSDFPVHPRSVGQLLWALAVLNLRPRALLGCLHALMSGEGKCLMAASGRDLLLFCWTLAVLEQTGSEAFQIAWNALSQKQLKEIGASITSATLYCQVIEELKVAGQGFRISAWHQASHGKYLECWMNVLQSEERLVSALQRDVMAAVELSGTQFVEEAIVGIYSVDIALPEYKVAIEVDGPSHFTRTMPRLPLGPTLMKRRHLEGAGWVVVSVGSDDWDASGESWQEKMCMLRDLVYKIEQERLEAGRGKA